MAHDWTSGTVAPISPYEGYRDPMVDVALAMCKGINPDLGTRPGQFLFCENGLAEVEERKDDKVKLTRLGWKPLSECRLTP